MLGSLGLETLLPHLQTPNGLRHAGSSTVNSSPTAQRCVHSNNQATGRSLPMPCSHRRAVIRINATIVASLSCWSCPSPISSPCCCLSLSDHSKASDTASVLVCDGQSPPVAYREAVQGDIQRDPARYEAPDHVKVSDCCR